MSWSYTCTIEYFGIIDVIIMLKTDYHQSSVLLQYIHPICVVLIQQYILVSVLTDIRC